MRLFALLTLLILFSISVTAASISQFPSVFVRDGTFNAFYVIGGEAPALDVVSATVISTSLARFNINTTVGTSRMDSELADVRQYDAVVIGNPCVNKAAALLEGNPSDCFQGLEGGIGYIKIYQHGAKTQVLITGIDEKDRKEAADFLASGDLSKLSQSVYSVSSFSGSVKPSPVNVSLNVSNSSTSNSSVVSNKSVKEIVKSVKNVSNSTVSVPVVSKNVSPVAYKPLSLPRVERDDGFVSGFFGAIKRFFSWLFG